MQNTPLVSVLLPYHNDELFIKEAVKSVLSSSFKNFELIILNHASEDSSRKIVRSFRDLRIKHFEMPKNYGAGGGLLFETMLSHAQGKYIKPFCADDVMRPNGLAELVNYLEEHHNVDFAFGDIKYIDKNGNHLRDSWFSSRQGFTRSCQNEDLILKFIHGESVLPWVGSIVRKSALDQILIDKTLIMLFDVSIWVSLLCKNYKISYLNKIVANYRIHPNQVSALENKDMSSALCQFEHPVIYKILLSITDIGLAKKIFPESPYKNKLDSKDDIAFFIAHSLLYKFWALSYQVLNDMLSNKDQMDYLSGKYNYDTATLRSDCRKIIETQLIHSQSENKLKKMNFKQRIYSKSMKELSIMDLAYLAIRKLSSVKKIWRKKKPYSL